MVVEEVKKVLESDMCAIINEHIVDQFNQLIRSYPTKMPLREIEQLDIKGWMLTKCTFGNYYQITQNNTSVNSIM